MQKTRQLVLELIDDHGTEGDIIYRHKPFKDLSPHVSYDTIFEGIVALSQLYRLAINDIIVKEEHSLMQNL